MQRDFREVVQSWLDGNFDEATKAQIVALQENDPVELEDAFYRNLEFGTGGLRGIMGVGTNRMNKYTVGMATQGLANYMKENCEGPLSVCISFDSRNNSPHSRSRYSNGCKRGPRTCIRSQEGQCPQRGD